MNAGGRVRGARAAARGTAWLAVTLEDVSGDFGTTVERMGAGLVVRPPPAMGAQGAGAPAAT